MKTLFILFLIAFSSFNCEGQQILTNRHRGGVSISSGTSFNSSRSELLLLTEKRAPLFALGGVYEYQHSSLISFRSGFGLEYSRATFYNNPNDSIDLYYFATRPHALREATCDYDQLIDAHELYPATLPRFRETISRKHKFGYFAIPMEVVVRSKMRNFNRFYALGGLKTSIRFRSVAREQLGNIVDSTTRYENILVRDANRLKFSLTGGVGFERVYTGSSSVYINVEFDFALNNTFSQRQKKASIYVGNNITEYPEIESLNGSSDFRSNSLRQNQIRVSVGLLF